MNNDQMHHHHPITVAEFCAGYAGIGLGLKRVLGERMRTVAYCELEGFAQANLISKMEAGLLDAAPIWSNLLSFPYGKFRGLVDIAVAGIPCQPHSQAGKRKGGSDERFLFDDWLRGLEAMQPGTILIENVEGLLTSKMPDGSLCIAWTIERLEGMGYGVEAGLFSASEVGAPHQRKRVFIMANRINEGSSGYSWNGKNWNQSRREREESLGSVSSGGLWRRVSFAGECLGGNDDELGNECSICGCDYCECSCPGPTQDGYEYAEFEGVLYAREQQDQWPARPGEPQHEWEPPRVC